MSLQKCLKKLLRKRRKKILECEWANNDGSFLDVSGSLSSWRTLRQNRQFHPKINFSLIHTSCGSKIIVKWRKLQKLKFGPILVILLQCVLNCSWEKIQGGPHLRAAMLNPQQSSLMPNAFDFAKWTLDLLKAKNWLMISKILSKRRH